MGNLTIDELSDESDLSSAPASPCLSPCPSPQRYPTPSSQVDAELAAEGSARQARPAKRRRNPLPKERTTQYIDLSKCLDQQKNQYDLLVQTLRHQKDIVVIAGAGISTAAGIPDFRSTDGLFKSLQKKHNLKASGKLLFDAAVYQDDALTAPFHEMVRSLSKTKTEPTRFHKMLARLGTESRLKRLYTQNIDGIETSMNPLATEVPLSVKGSWPVTIQLHGSIEWMVCQKCCYLTDFQADMFTEADPPACTDCAVNDQNRMACGLRSHGIGRMRPRIVLYNEHNPDEEAIASVMNADIKSRPRVLIVAGTSLKIPGVRRLVKSMCATIRSRKDGVTMFINNELPSGKEFDDCFDLIVKGSCDEVAHQTRLEPWNSDDKTPCTYDPSLEPIPLLKSSLNTHGHDSDLNAVSVIVPPKKRSRIDIPPMSPSSSHDEKPAKKPATKATKDKIKNPASQGTSIKDAIEKTHTAVPKAAPKAVSKAAPKSRAKRPAPKAASKKRGMEPTVQVKKNATLNSFHNVRVTKTSQSAGIIGTKVDGKAMQPVPAGASRNNGPMPSKAAEQLVKTDMSLNLETIPQVVASS
ncbi:Sirtuin family [Penicillium paradoxum]|uniref:Sirtuin family n=1 Tax=Penicillium paradoxum TaxID=176176 RepID=UPI002548D54C|nr:Sirtuin family [Penicillium paradoxum]KAJ5794126.1 Sirtuin family [Penicillium paradoxum]